jgi:hypothetical protein
MESLPILHHKQPEPLDYVIHNAVLSSHDVKSSCRTEAEGVDTSSLFCAMWLLFLAWVATMGVVG